MSVALLGVGWWSPRPWMQLPPMASGPHLLPPWLISHAGLLSLFSQMLPAPPCRGPLHLLSLPVPRVLAGSPFTGVPLRELPGRSAWDRTPAARLLSQHLCRVLVPSDQAGTLKFTIYLFIICFFST